MTPAEHPSEPADEVVPPPPPLIAAAGITAVEGLLFVLLSVLEAFSVQVDRLTMGITTAVFLIAYGVFLVVCAWLVTHGETWARGPVLLAQLIQLGIAWNIRHDALVPAIVMAVVSVIVIAGMLHPDSVRALNPELREESS